MASAAAGRKEFRGSGAERAAQRTLQAEERSSSLRPGLCPYKAPFLLTASVSPPAPWSSACLWGQSLGWGTGVNSREPLGRRTNEHCLARVEQSLAGMPPLQGLSPLPGLPTCSPKGMMGVGQLAVIDTGIDGGDNDADDDSCPVFEAPIGERPDTLASYKHKALPKTSSTGKPPCLQGLTAGNPWPTTG